MPVFGYQQPMGGKPMAFKQEVILTKQTPVRAEVPYYPIIQWRNITEEEFKLSLDELIEKYPFKRST